MEDNKKMHEVEITWTEQHYGTVMVEAESESEAEKKVGEEPEEHLENIFESGADHYNGITHIDGITTV